MNQFRIRLMIEPILRCCMHFYWRFARGLTLGVRALVFDAQGRVFLVKHSYVGGWHLPGGGVEAGETVLAALQRELQEEGNISLLETPRLHGIFFNGHASRRDHVLVYVVDKFAQPGKPSPNREIVDCGFFPVTSLPSDTTNGTRQRILEVIEGQAKSVDWLGTEGLNAPTLGSIDR